MQGLCFDEDREDMMAYFKRRKFRYQGQTDNFFKTWPVVWTPDRSGATGGKLGLHVP